MGFRKSIMKFVQIIGIIVLKYIMAIPFFVGVIIEVLVTGLFRRIFRRKKPRLLWGTQAIGGTQYYSQACRLFGYQSDTLMYASFHSNRPEDFDYYPWTILPFRILHLPFIYKYLCFMWALPRYEIFFHNFNGGLLYRTLFEKMEIHLWHMAGCKIVVYPFGGDVQVPSRFKDLLFKHTLFRHYPEQGKNEELTVKRIYHLTRHADFIFTSVEAVDYLPYWDLMLMQMSAVNTDYVNPERMSPGELRLKYPDKLIVFHATNHRHLKGTDLLIMACDELKKERNDFELVVYDRCPNDVLLQAAFDADIIVDQFVIGVYAMFALEGMAMEKPVVGYIRPDLKELWMDYSWGKDCPIFQTPREKIKENIRFLLDHPEERARLGQEGKKFVYKFHSLQSMGKLYDAIIQKVWMGESIIDNILREQCRTLL